MLRIVIRAGIASILLFSVSSVASAQLPAPVIGKGPPRTPPQVPIPTGCKILNAHGWTGIYTRGGGKLPPALTVRGWIATQTHVELGTKDTDSDPATVTLVLSAMPPANANGRVTIDKVSAIVPDVPAGITKVIIRCGRGQLAEFREITKG